MPLMILRCSAHRRPARGDAGVNGTLFRPMDNSCSNYPFTEGGSLIDIPCENMFEQRRKPLRTHSKPVPEGIYRFSFEVSHGGVNRGGSSFFSAVLLLSLPTTGSGVETVSAVPEMSDGRIPQGVGFPPHSIFAALLPHRPGILCPCRWP